MLTPWSSPESDPLADLQRVMERGRTELSGPPKGHPDNPFDLVLPRWLEDRAVAAGTTLQQVADEEFRVAVRVVVVDADL